MNLSMWNVYDWLCDRNYKVLPSITTDRATIKSARILNADVTDHSAVYVGSNIGNLSNQDSVFLVNGKDIIYLDDADYESVFNEITRMFEFYTSWELELNKCAVSENGLQEMIDLSFPVIGIPIFIYDASGRVLAISNEYPLDMHYHWKELYTLRNIPEHRLEELKQHGNLSMVFSQKGPTYFDSSPFGVSYLYSSIIVKDKLLAHLVYFASLKPIPRGSIYLMHIMVEAIKSHFRIHFTNYIDHYQIANIILDYLGKKEIPEKIIKFELNRINWRIDDSYILLVFFEPVEGKPVMRDRIGNNLAESIHHCQKIIFEDYLVLLVNLSKYEKGTGILFQKVNKLVDLHLKCGSSYPFNDFRKLDTYFSQAVLTVNISPKTGKVSNVYDYALTVITDILSGNELLNSLVHPDILTLQTYDSKHNTDFCKTLKEYLNTSGNLNLLSKILNIHRNTAYYRINRIRELINCDIDDPKIRNYLTLSYYILGE